MRKKKVILRKFCVARISFATYLLISACASDRTESNIENVVDLCANFSEKSDEYQLSLLMDNVSLVPNPLWVYPDKVNCYSTVPCYSKWVSSFSIDIPHEGDVVQHYRHPEMIGMRYRSSTHESQIFPIDTSLKLNPMQFEMLEIKLSNARDSLPLYYGRLLEGVWSAKQAYDASIHYERPFFVRIVGECDNPPIVANYCLSENLPVLYEIEIKRVYPLKRLFSEQVRMCSGSYRLKKTLCLKSPDGEKEVLSFEELGEVGNRYVVGSKILLPEPKWINVENFSTEFFRTHEEIEAAWTIVLECDDERFEKRVPFAIGLKGVCKHDPIMINLDPGYTQFNQGRELH